MRMTLIDELIAELDSAHAAFLAALDGVTQEEFERRPPGEVTEGEERWPILEVCWHLGQYDDYQRRTILAATEGRPLPKNEPTKRPEYLNTPDQQREWLAQSRRALVVMASRLDEETLNREFEGLNGRTVTARGLLRWVARHEQAHITQVEALRSLPPEEH
ncbi:MAG: DinB family protein [Dehalococcoidia bacterium]|nr:MAG: DinB family protein [Dehalococcoidia bacterium]